MRHQRVRPAAALAVLVAVGCSDATRPSSEPPPVRTVLFHRQDTGENLLLNTDGSGPGALPSVTMGLPLGTSAFGRLVVLLSGRALTLVEADRGDRLDTILNPVPDVLSLASISGDERFVAIVSYAPTQAVILYDRANRLVDTLPYGSIEPALPPLFSPDNERVVLFSVAPLSIVMTRLFLADRSRQETAVLRISRVVNRPIFGWPRWTDDGILMAFVRVAANAPDTLLVGRVDPDDDTAPLVELYRAVMAPGSDDRPELAIGDYSTYALTADGRALVLGAQVEAGVSRQGIYLVTPDVGRVAPLLDDPARFPIFPLFLRD